MLESPIETLRVEAARKAIHVTSGLVPISYAVLESRPIALGILAVMCASMLLLEWLRRRGNPVARLFQRMFGFMLRAHETDRWLGATHYCLASLVCVALAPRAAAVPALLFLALGDTAASMVGLAIGRVRIGQKTLEGTLGFIGVTVGVVLALHGWKPEYPLAAGAIGAMASAIVELTLTRIDDNWTVPLVGATVISMLLAANGGAVH